MDKYIIVVTRKNEGIEEYDCLLNNKIYNKETVLHAIQNAKKEDQERKIFRYTYYHVRVFDG